MVYISRCAVFVLLMAQLCGLHADEDTTPDHERADAIAEAIVAARDQDDTAKVYRAGDVFGRSVFLGADQYAMFWHTMSDSGGVTESQGHRRLTSRSGKRTLEFVAIRWGDREYLVENSRSDMISFCNDVNAGLEPRRTQGGTRWLLRDKDWERNAPGLPRVPEEYHRYLHRTPIAAEVALIHADEEVAFPFPMKGPRVTFVIAHEDASDEEVFAGMRLHFGNAKAYVTTVGNDSFEAVVDGEYPIRILDTWSTRSPRSSRLLRAWRRSRQPPNESRLPRNNPSPIDDATPEPAMEVPPERDRASHE